ncbi:hypothetical protein BOTBODRAFT_111266 [Botryobasidium botryosum FD-172 SS1]|uniref:K Homology domain-containing protein n=1 Tax=Botryobasidium botryosum (strain FD-172 SS1) TaxID=930990 RepID=A0A067MFY3_BOTB1|nr:hypothetical protein BOTBODRAFT_111266 [Botryobasidium botryosum FD-172 SS1]
MDIYSVSFSLSSDPQHVSSANHSPASSLDFTLDFRAPYDTSRTFPVRPRSASTTSLLASPDFGVDAVQKVCVDAIATHGCLVSFTRSEDTKSWNFHLSGGYQQVMAARGMILRNCPVVARSSIKVARSEILESASSSTLKPDVRRRLDEIASQTRANVSVVHNSSQAGGPPAPDGIHGGAWAGLESERMCDLVITGTGESVEVARILLLVMLDEISGLHSEVCEIDHKLHCILAGRKRSVVHSIQEETATNVYFPNPLQPLLGGPPQNANVIWITGEFFGVQRARDMLFQLSMHKTKSIIPRDIALLPRKLDWMLTERKDELKAIMVDNGTFINFPLIGSQTSLISVYGDNQLNIQRTVRAVMQLASQFYVASFWLLPTHFNPLMPPATVNPVQIPPTLKRISITSGAEVVFKSNCFEVHGLEHHVRVAIGMILDLDVVKGFHHEIRFQLELANEHRDFISGKKNGKLNKIMQSANVKIKFETFNDHNFLIDLAGNDVGALHGLTMLQEELPAEISFHVPEIYHKRIIGVGGRCIQRIMKKYGVYVKFNSSEELATALLDNEDNVVARTPAKNALNLEHLKQSVMELVNPKDKDYTLETINIPRRYHRSLFGERSIFLHDIESKTNSKIRFPGDDVITIFGPESQVHVAAAMILDHIPLEVDMLVPSQPELARVCTTPDFVAFLERMNREMQVAVVPHIKTSGSDESSFKFRCQRSNSDFLAPVREMLESYLVKHHVQVYATHAASASRADSFTDAFPHFNSKLLSSAPAGMLSHSTQSPELSRPSEGFVERRIRLASSTPDVKALFNNSPSYVYKLPEQDESEDTLSSSKGRHSSHSSYSSYAHGSGLSLHGPRALDDILKRGSDSLLESKLKEHVSKPRSLSNRAQSLDITSLSRSGSMNTISERLSRPEPESPLETTFPSPPPSAVIPAFPSVNGPILGRAAAGAAGRPRTSVTDREGGRVEPTLDEVSRVIAQMRLDA